MGDIASCRWLIWSCYSHDLQAAWYNTPSTNSCYSLATTLLVMQFYGYCLGHTWRVFNVGGEIRCLSHRVVLLELIFHLWRCHDPTPQGVLSFKPLVTRPAIRFISSLKVLPSDNCIQEHCTQITSLSNLSLYATVLQLVLSGSHLNTSSVFFFFSKAQLYFFCLNALTVSTSKLSW